MSSIYSQTPWITKSTKDGSMEYDEQETIECQNLDLPKPI